jgi:hypothetical protein
VRSLPTRSPFTRADARAAGWSDSALTRAARVERVTRIRRGQFALSTDPVLAARAAAASCGGSVISHRSATLLHGLPLLDPAPARPDLTVQPNGTGDVAGALLHRASLPPEHVMVLDGVCVTTPARTMVDLGRTIGSTAAVVSIDAALNRDLTTKEELADVLDLCRRWPRIRQARRAVTLADGASESPLESVSRLVMRSGLGLPEPQLQAVVRDPRGRFVGRCDFYWDEAGVFGEADGRGKYDSRAVLIEEKRRQEELENLGLVGVRWEWDDVRFRQGQLFDRIQRAFERGRLRDAAGFPRNWSIDNR